MISLKNTIILVICIIISMVLNAQIPTVGLLEHKRGSYDSVYILFSPMYGTKTYLIDKCGRKIHEWESKYLPGMSSCLLPDGRLLRPAVIENQTFTASGKGGLLQMMDWEGNIVWEYKVSTPEICQHHDFEPLPNGNILVIAWEDVSVLAIPSGRNPNYFSGKFFSEKIMEIKPIGKDSGAVVWEWRSWDHIIQDYDSNFPNYGNVSEHPELIDVNYGTFMFLADWLHFNSISYNEHLDQIMVSSLQMNEIWIIDHSTTMAEAASHSGGKYGRGGDLLYRWGNPAAYKMGGKNDQKFFGQHDARWIDKSPPWGDSIMVFNNSNGPVNGKYSSIDIIIPPIYSSGNYHQSLPYLPHNQSWRYISEKKTDFYSGAMSGSQYLPNGNIITCLSTTGSFLEFDKNNNKVWEYKNPVNQSGHVEQGQDPLNNAVFNFNFYPFDYSGFDGQNLKPRGHVELKPYIYDCDLFIGIEENTPDYNVFLPECIIFKNRIIEINTEYSHAAIYDLNGKCLKVIKNQSDIELQEFTDGMYILKVVSGSNTLYHKFMLF